MLILKRIFRGFHGDLTVVIAVVKSKKRHIQYFLVTTSTTVHQRRDDQPSRTSTTSAKWWSEGCAVSGVSSFLGGEGVLVSFALLCVCSSVLVFVVSQVSHSAFSSSFFFSLCLFLSNGQ